MSNPNTPLTIAIVAGEISGDTLGADFMQKMNAINPHITWLGVGGDKMIQQGLQCVINMERLSVMGLVEVVRHLPNLMQAKREILTACQKADIDIFVGIDAPDFNLRLGKALKPTGVFCVQYVSPSIWAWRENRIHTIKAATHLVLCLFPFELPVYVKYQHQAVCVGHQLTHQLQEIDNDKKNQLKNKYLPQFLASADTASPIICLMAGSRLTEIGAILPILLNAFAKLVKIYPNAHALLPLAKDEHAPLVQSLIDKTTPHLRQRLHCLNPSQCPNGEHQNIAQLMMSLSDITLLASGTATLECMLLATPMVVVYQVNAITFAIAKRLLKTPFVALPNILHHANTKSTTAIVPELLQSNATADNVATAAQAILNNPAPQRTQLHALSQTLKAQSQQNPAEAVFGHYQAFLKKRNI